MAEHFGTANDAVFNGNERQQNRKENWNLQSSSQVAGRNPELFCYSYEKEDEEATNKCLQNKNALRSWNFCDERNQRLKSPFYIYPFCAFKSETENVLLRNLMVFKDPFTCSYLPPQVRLAQTFYTECNGNQKTKNKGKFGKEFFQKQFFRLKIKKDRVMRAFHLSCLQFIALQQSLLPLQAPCASTILQCLIWVWE